MADSAGTATAILSGVKTRLGLLGVDSRVQRNSCDSQVLERAKVTGIMHWAVAAGKEAGKVAVAGTEAANTRHPLNLDRTRCTCFGSTYTKIGTIQRRLAWPLRKDDTQNREAFHIFCDRSTGPGKKALLGPGPKARLKPVWGEKGSRAGLAGVDRGPFVPSRQLFAVRHDWRRHLVCGLRHPASATTELRQWVTHDFAYSRSVAKNTVQRTRTRCSVKQRLRCQLAKHV